VNTMRRHAQLALIALLIVSIGCHAESSEVAARTWFMTKFAPLWESLDEADPHAVRAFWTDDFRDHPVDMDSSIWKNSLDTWQHVIEKNRAEGLSGSTVIALDVEAINERAVIIRAKWMDRGTEGQVDDPYYCGTYIAASFQGEWKFTNYFTVECRDP